jgi:aminopeptidase N
MGRSRLCRRREVKPFAEGYGLGQHFPDSRIRMQEAKPKKSHLKIRTWATPSLNARWSPLVLIFLLFLSTSATAFEYAGEDMLDYSLDISFNIPASIVKGVVIIPVKKGQEIKLDTGKLNLIYVNLDKERMDISGREGTVEILSPREGRVEIGFEGVFQSDGREETSSVIDSRGIFLTGTWYPKPDRMCHYRLTATLPDGYEAMSEAETIDKTIKDGNALFSFDFPHPLDSVNFIAASRYEIAKDHFGGVEIFAYFFAEDRGLVKTYIEHAKQYLNLYDHLICRFPYKRFSIVENFLPTGYSMPTYTLLGQEVVRLPFIPETSLGHEILHQWLGNLVYIDGAKGNWAEGLTTFLADHLYEEEKGRGFEYRKGRLIDYQSYVNAKNVFPLKDFKERTNRASEAIGYGKALMVFQMLKKLVGEERFYESVRYFVNEMRFRKASWEDIERAFEKYYQRDLAWFFNQWVDGKGLAEIFIEDAEVKPSGPKFEVTFTLSQRTNIYALDFPVALYSYRGKVENLFHLDTEKGHFKMLIDDIPERLVIDEDYDLARTLSASEFPPVIERLIGEESPIIVLPTSGIEVYDEIVHAFKKREARVSDPDRLKFKDLQSSSTVILGGNNPLVGRLYGKVASQGGFSVLMKENPWNAGKVAGIFDARSKEEVNAAFQKIFHYGKYSFLSFDHGINIQKKIEETSRGVKEELFKPPVAAEISALKALPEVMERVAGKKIAYVGENHEQFSHHVMALEIIKDLHRREKKIAIGMEMFQRPFQKVLDDYIEGKIDEKEFLKGTQYFKRWGFDYNLYRPILEFAKSERIPVVALNMRQEIVDSVFRGGFDSLSGEEKELLPSRMDFSDDAYKERLKKVFQEHEDFGAGNFNFFYQAQILWDETMSESIDEFLKSHPSDHMVVLAGNGHLAYGSGIPKRTARRNGYDYAIILNGADLEKDVADYVLFPKTMPGITSPKLMVLLKEKGGKVEIAGFPPGSNSEKAGVMVGDIFLSIDHTPVRTIDDLKIDLLFKKKGDKVDVKILRKGFWGAQKEMDFEVTLQ